MLSPRTGSPHDVEDGVLSIPHLGTFFFLGTASASSDRFSISICNLRGSGDRATRCVGKGAGLASPHLDLLSLRMLSMVTEHLRKMDPPFSPA